VQVFGADGRPYKSYSLYDLLGWSSEGAGGGGVDVEPQTHHLLKLKKRSNGSTDEFSMQRGEALTVVNELEAVSRAMASASAADLMGHLDDDEEEMEGGRASENATMSAEQGQEEVAAWLATNADDADLFTIPRPEEYSAAVVASLMKAGYEVDEWMDELQSFSPSDLNVFLETVAQHYTREGELAASKAIISKKDMLSLFTQTGVTAIHVGGLEGELESESVLTEVFSTYGTVLAATLRVRREIKNGKQVVSWALVSFRAVAEAEAAVAAAGEISGRYGGGVVLKTLDEAQVITSTGAMGDVMRKHVKARMETRLLDRSVADVEMLAAVPWLSPALQMTGGADFLTALAAELQERSVPVGEVIIRQGEVEDEMYFVASGCVEVKVSLSKPAVATLPVGSAFGESALLNNEPRNAFVLAAADGDAEPLEQGHEAVVRLLVLNKEGLARAMSRFPSVEAVMEEDSWLWKVQSQHDFYTEALEHV